MPHVALLVTCLVDLMRPAVGFAAVKLLEAAGCTVHVPEQTCCGQPAYNSGDRATAIDLAEQMIASFTGFEYVVVPSGSCAGMVIRHYPELLRDRPSAAAAAALAARTHELVAFLTDVLKIDQLEGRLEATVTYHDSCSGLRELGIKHQPRRLLTGLAGATLIEHETAETCCGFGGTFCVKYPDISNRLVEDKCRAITATGAAVLAAGDMGCLLNLAGKLARQGAPVEVRHIAELLAGVDGPAIGQEIAP
jgi:L-lactate dehydrogenase complex protein LldE